MRNGIVCGLPKAVGDFLLNLVDSDESKIKATIEESLNTPRTDHDGKVVKQCAFTHWNWKGSLQHYRQINLN